MAASYIQAKCSICNERTKILLCQECLKEFCADHLTQHQQSLNKQFDLIQNDLNQFRLNLTDLRNNPLKHPSIEQIDQWENESILKIKEKATEYRQILINYTNDSMNQTAKKLNDTDEQFRSNKIYLKQLKEKFEELNEEFNRSKNIFIDQKSNSFINEISIRFPSISKFFQLL